MSEKRVFLAWLGSLCLVLVLGCSPKESSRPAIVKGELVEARERPVVALMKTDSEGVPYVYCSGVLISPRHVLTAAHCSQGPDDKVYNADDVRVLWGENNPEQRWERVVAVASIARHPSYNPSRMSKDADGLIRPSDAHDLAVWHLAEAFSDDTPIAKLLAPQSQDRFLKFPHLVQILGFGAQSGFDSPWEPHLLREATTPYQPELVWDVRRRERVEGRLVTRVVKVELSAFTALEFFAGAKAEADTCKGDSGGPLMLKASSGQSLLVGITSRGDAQCDRGGVYTLVPAFVPWLREQAPELLVEEL